MWNLNDQTEECDIIEGFICDNGWGGWWEENQNWDKQMKNNTQKQTY